MPDLNDIPSAVFGENYSLILISKDEFARWGRGLDEMLVGARFVKAGLRFEDYDAARAVHEKISQRVRSAIGYAARKAMLEQQEQYHTMADLKVIWEIQKGRCYYTNALLGDSFGEASFSVDHIEPISQGGHDGPLNIALTTPVINRKKWYTSKRAFLKKLGFSEAEKDRMWMIDNARKAHFYLIDRRKPNEPEVLES